MSGGFPYEAGRVRNISRGIAETDIVQGAGLLCRLTCMKQPLRLVNLHPSIHRPMIETMKICGEGGPSRNNLLNSMCVCMCARCLLTIVHWQDPSKDTGGLKEGFMARRQALDSRPGSHTKQASEERRDETRRRTVGR